MFFITLKDFKCTGYLFCRPTLSVNLSDVSSWLTVSFTLGRNITKIIFCYSQCIIISGTLCWFMISDNINIDHLFNVVSIRFPHCNFIFFFFEGNAHFRGVTLILSISCYFSNSNSLMLASSDDLWWNQWILWWLLIGHFLIPHSFLN